LYKKGGDFSQILGIDMINSRFYFLVDDIFNLCTVKRGEFIKKGEGI